MSRKSHKTFCKRCFSYKKLEEMVANIVYGPGYKYLCKKCDALDAKSRKLGITRSSVNSNGLRFCEKCDEIKPTCEMVFYNKAQKHANVCKECNLKYKRKFKNNNRNRINESNRRSYIKNAEKLKEKRHKVKDKKSIYDKEYRKKRKRNFRKERDRDKERRNTDMFYHIKFYLRRRIKKAFKAAGYTKRSKSENVLGIKWEDLLSHFLVSYSIDILDKNYMKDKHIDHICPLAQAQNKEELIKLCHYTNLQIIPSWQNMKKSKSRTPYGERKCLELLGRKWIEYGN